MKAVRKTSPFFLNGKPLRTCKSLHECCLCDRPITYQDNYRDGGYGKRAHETCVQGSIQSARDMRADMYGGADG
jgi:hypothetical protein